MKVKNIILLVIMMFSLTACSYLEDDEPESMTFAYSVETSVKDICSDITHIYTDSQNSKYYSYCLDSIKIVGSSINSSITDALKNGMTITDILKYMEISSVLKDGGTKIYRDAGTNGYTNNGLTIIACNKIISNEKINKDYYIGPKNMKYQNNYCIN